MAEAITTQQTVYQDWVTAPSEQMINQMQTMMGQPLTIPGQQVAGFSPTQTAAMQQAYGGIGAYKPYLQAAGAGQTAAMAQWEPALARSAECNSIQAAQHNGWIHTSKTSHKGL